MTDKVETPKPTAAAAATKAERAPRAKLKLAIALNRINGDILPGTPLALDAATFSELDGLQAIREASEAEEALYEKSPESVVKITAAKKATDDLDAALAG